MGDKPDNFIRRLYVEKTGDMDNAYAVDESDVERYKYSDNTLIRALKAQEAVEDETQAAYMGRMFMERGPRAGVLSGQLYPMTSEYGENRARDYIEAYGDTEGMAEVGLLGLRAMNELTSRGTSPNAKFGMVRGLLRYLMER